MVTRVYSFDGHSREVATWVLARTSEGYSAAISTRINNAKLSHEPTLARVFMAVPVAPRACSGIGAPRHSVRAVGHVFRRRSAPSGRRYRTWAGPKLSRAIRPNIRRPPRSNRANLHPTNPWDYRVDKNQSDTSISSKV